MGDRIFLLRRRPEDYAAFEAYAAYSRHPEARPEAHEARGTRPWPGGVRRHRWDEAWSASRWQTFVRPRCGCSRPGDCFVATSTCGCKRFKPDALGDHVSTCTSHSGAMVSRKNTTGHWSILLCSSAQRPRSSLHIWPGAGWRHRADLSCRRCGARPPGHGSVHHALMLISC
jgi:hypothetical protein